VRLVTEVRARFEQAAHGEFWQRHVSSFLLPMAAADMTRETGLGMDARACAHERPQACV
jgi:hypothetical protein